MRGTNRQVQCSGADITAEVLLERRKEKTHKKISKNCKEFLVA